MSEPSSGSELQGWVATHKPLAALLGAIAAVAGYGLYKRHQANTAASTTPSADTTGTTASTSDVAGLSGNPDDYATQIESWVQDALNQQNQQLQDQLNNPSAPGAPAAAQPAPKPGSAIYTVKAGDTLKSIAQQVYGSYDGWAVNLLRMGNPILGSFYYTAPLSFFTGETLTIPAAPNPAPSSAAPKPKQPIVSKPNPKGASPSPVRPTPAPKPKATTSSYTVRSGDTLSGIASRLHVAGGWQSLYAKNRKVIGSNPNQIRPGQRLVI